MQAPLRPLTGVMDSAAQVDLIVGLNPSADGLRSGLAGSAAKSDALQAVLAGIVSIRPYVPLRVGAADRPVAFVLTTADSAAHERLATDMVGLAGVKFVQNNFEYMVDAVLNDPFADSLDHLPVIRATDAWAFATGADDVEIGIIDTGVSFMHPDLDGRYWINPGEDLNQSGSFEPSDLDGIDNDGNGYVDDVRGFDFVDRSNSVEAGDYQGRDADPTDDGSGHGTTVAGVAGAARDNNIGITGVAYDSPIAILRAFGADGRGEDDDVSAAIVYAADMGIDVLNLSFGDVYYSPLMHESIRYAVSKGTVVVASAGNLGGDDPHYPSDYPEVISVVWLSSSGASAGSRATFGLGVDIGAPGSQVFTTTFPAPDIDEPTASDLYGRRSGSSMSAPMVSAAAAMVRSLDSSLSPAAVQAILVASATDIGPPGWDHRTGSGLLNVTAAVTSALPARAEIIAPQHDAGSAESTVAIVGSAVDPSFRSFTLEYAAGDTDLDSSTWSTIKSSDRQAYRDTLATWDIAGLPEGPYTLRLRVDLRSGRTVEDRRRFFIDRTPANLDLRVVATAIIDGRHGIVADLATDDLTDASMTIEGASGNPEAVKRVSDRKSTRHLLEWSDDSGAGGSLDIRISAMNASGLVADTALNLSLPSAGRRSGIFRMTSTSVPHGFLLEKATDFDDDGLLEITFNQYEDGWLGDTLSTYEWDGSGFVQAHKTVANVFPRDTGDTDGDGLQELLAQVGASTLLLEQQIAGAYPGLEVFLDTVGVANPVGPLAVWGARLTDLDDDGAGEILSHNTKEWRLLELSGNEYTLASTLTNPTGVANSELSENNFEQPQAIIDDLDGDGAMEIVTGDADGDWIVYENSGDNSFRVAWTHETDRYNAGSRLAAGDFDGDGNREFVGFTQNWVTITSNHDLEPDISLYTVFESDGDDSFAETGRFAIPGEISRHGTAAAVDFDADSIDELVIVNPPQLYVLREDQGEWAILGGSVCCESEEVRSIKVVAADFDSDGLNEVVVAGANETMYVLELEGSLNVTPVPDWTQSFALSADSAALAWYAPLADSVSVYRGVPGESLDLIETTTAPAIRDAISEPAVYRLKAWSAGEVSPLGPARTIRPHAPAVLEHALAPSAAEIRLTFSGPLAASTEAGQFLYGDDAAPSAIAFANGGRTCILRFGSALSSGGILRWFGVTDEEGTPVATTEAAVDFGPGGRAELIVEAWQFLSSSELTVTFSEPLDPATAADVGNYRLEPSGMVADARIETGDDATVRLRVSGRAVGATGLQTTLRIDNIRGQSGSVLALEGNTIRLTEAAVDLSDVFVFPNPFDASLHSRLIIAGLPPTATVTVYAADGSLVAFIEETDGDGGVQWNLLDRSGASVPSGIYMLRVEADGASPVLKKAAVIR